MTTDVESSGPDPADELRADARRALEHALGTLRQGSRRVYDSLRNLNEVVGTEYGDRVLYELIQNAHDAHRADDSGRIAVQLVIRSDGDGTLYVANGGDGFHRHDVDAIQHIATTAKRVGEGIGNKGLGFRSIETLTDDVRVYSRRNRSASSRFDGYCFRFASPLEMQILLRADGVAPAIAREVSEMVPRYLVPMPLAEQPSSVARYARSGYASVIVAPLRTESAVKLAEQQVQALADLEVPLLLFLERVEQFRIEMATPDGNLTRRFTRNETPMGLLPGLAGGRISQVRVRENHRFLIVRHDVAKARVLEAVRQSVPGAPQMKRWLDWKGQPTVSVAVGLSPGVVTQGRLYNFLPMGDAAVAPFLGHLNAPFFAHIDRRNADFRLPLNATLMDAAAEACARAALHLAGSSRAPVPQHAVFDLIAWSRHEVDRLDAALGSAGTSLREARLIPVFRVADGHWASLGAVYVWPDAPYRLLKAREVARRTGALLVSAEVDAPRLERLRAIASRERSSLSPSAKRLAEWSEAFAAWLADKEAAPLTWRGFYDDLPRLFDAAGESLEWLAGKAIILDRFDKLRPAGGRDVTSAAAPFVRVKRPQRRRSRDDLPLPPSSLARRYWFLHERIALPTNVLKAFLDAGLVRRYGPVEALAALGPILRRRSSWRRTRR